MALKTDLIEYTHNGDTLEAFVAWDDTQEGERPAVLVCHAWGGRDEHSEETAKKMAAMGYVGFAVDVYGKGVRGSSKEENQKLMTPFVEDRDMLADRLKAGMEAAAGLDTVNPAKIAVCGYCFGGLCALDMARANTGVIGAAAFHAILGKPEKPGSGDISAKVLAMQGFDDPMATPEDETAFGKEMTERKADWQLHVYGGVMHAFTNKQANDPDFGTVYDATADRRSWTTFTDFLEEVLD
ncbi:dienelactone hydrolase family protein [Parvularcula flava]|uniref:Carboxymethylenebutenolidase n=1 Tax=Aquisalinus luteolus TaxID=1566827 RepID=A0A8J3A3J1_9PROT|nr:dienelactone hydrolase family protein [Aquisalinus luteolus]NHK29065.1 dienelactone hydrolase family protein [Aquisalinus luteolus]GGI00418.1 carboxymethylenebutenolidase [Aquisalinus luteolus]